MLGVTFGNKNTYTDFNMILNNHQIGTPEAKTETVDVIGADGELDFTEFSGRVNYKNRILIFDFTKLGAQQQRVVALSNFRNAFHGKKVNIILEEIEPTFYYVGRLAMSDPVEERGYSTFSVSANCEPYKYKVSETIISQTVNTSKQITLSNLQMPVVPKITTTANITVVWTGGSVSISAGTDLIIPELVLNAGNTVVTVRGNATVTFKYREGGL